MSGRLRPIAAAVLTSALLPLCGLLGRGVGHDLDGAGRVVADRRVRRSRRGVRGRARRRGRRARSGRRPPSPSRPPTAPPATCLRPRTSRRCRSLPRPARSPTIDDFATNVLVIATSSDNPAAIAGLADLSGITWVRCADEVPCGRVAARRARRPGHHGRTREPGGGRARHARQADRGRGRRRPGLRAPTRSLPGDAVTTIAIPGAETSSRRTSSRRLTRPRTSTSPRSGSTWCSATWARQALTEQGSAPVTVAIRSAGHRWSCSIPAAGAVACSWYRWRPWSPPPTPPASSTRCVPRPPARRSGSRS